MLKLSTGALDALNGYEAIVGGALIGATLALVDGGAGADSITHSGNGFITAGFAPGRKLFLKGATTAANDAAVTGVRAVTVAAGTITLPTGTVNTAETFAAGTVLAFAKGGSFKDLFKDGRILIYSGTQPTSPDDAVVGSLLATITVSSGAFVAGAFDNGLEFENDPTGGIIEKDADAWSALASATGTAGWFRFLTNAADAGTSSTTAIRMDGTVGVGSGDLRFSTVSWTAGKTYTIDEFKITMPSYYGA